MASTSYSFLDIVVLDEVREGFVAGDALAILSTDLEEILWANGAGASWLGFPAIEAAIGEKPRLPATALRQIAAAPGFPRIGRGRTIGLRITSGLSSRIVTLQASAIELPRGEDALLLALPSANGSSADERARRAIAGFHQAGHFAALVDADGTVTAASAGFEALQIDQDTLEALVRDVGREAGRLVKKRIAARAHFPAGIARLTDDPPHHLLLVVDDGSPDILPSQPAAAADAAAVAPEEAPPAGLAALPDSQESETPLLATFDEEAAAAEPIAAQTSTEGEPQTDVADRQDAPEAPLAESPREGDGASADAIPEQALPAQPPATEDRLQTVTEPAAEAERPDDRIEPAAPPASEMPAPRTVRFSWRTDAEGRFSAISDEFAEAMGKNAADVIGRTFKEVSNAFGLDPEGSIARLLERRDTWSGRTVMWPLEGTKLKVPVDLAALPVYGRGRVFEGFRGFGIARLGEAEADPESIGTVLAPIEPQDEEEPDAEGSPAAEPEQQAEATLAGDGQESDPFRGEKPAITVSREEPQAPADEKIIHLAERRDGLWNASLTASERTAFREIGERLRRAEAAPVADANAQDSHTRQAEEAVADEAIEQPRDEMEPDGAALSGDSPSLEEMSREPAAEEPRQGFAHEAEPASVTHEGTDAAVIEPLPETTGYQEQTEAEPRAEEEIAGQPESLAPEADGRQPRFSLVGEPEEPADTASLGAPSALLGRETEDTAERIAPGDENTPAAERADGHEAALRDDGRREDGSPAPADEPKPVEPGDEAARTEQPDIERSETLVEETHARSQLTDEELPIEEAAAQSEEQSEEPAPALHDASPVDERQEREREPQAEMGEHEPQAELPVSAVGMAAAVASVAENAWEEVTRPAEPSASAEEQASDEPPSQDVPPEETAQPAAQASEPVEVPEAEKPEAEKPEEALTFGDGRQAEAAAPVQLAATGTAVGNAESEPASSGEEDTGRANRVPDSAPSPEHLAETQAAEARDSFVVVPLAQYQRRPEPVAEEGQVMRPEVGGEPSLLAHLPLPILVHSGDRLHYANREFFKLTGYADLVALEAAGGIGALFGETSVSGEAPREKLLLSTADGAEVPVEAHLQSISWEGGKALMLAFHPAAKEPTPEDAAKAAELEARLSEMRAIVDTATDGVAVIAGDGTIRSINRPAEALFGFDAENVVGKPFTSLFAIESQRTVQDYLAALSDNGVASVLNDGRQVIGREAQGRFIPLFITIGRLPNGSGYCAVLRDITHWKRAEEELTQARAQAERASSQKSEFLARVSHEVRTPLNAIIGFSELMIDEKFGPIGNERYRDYLRDINRSGNHVLELVNDLLDISKIEAGQQEMAYEAVSLNDALAQVVAMMQPQANSERVIIRSSFASRLPDVVADLRSVRQIAINLLSNAVRYTPAGGQVIVSTAYERDGSVVVRVRDTGVGMSSAELDEALKPFKQINALRRKRGDGTGLGLPLTRAMVEANRAQFAIASTPGEGTLVEITFPPTRVLAE